MFVRVDTVIVRVHDLRAAQQWYATMLGLSAAYVDEAEGLAVLALEGTSLTLWQLRPGEGELARGPGSYPILAVPDAAAAHAHLASRGVAVEAVQVGPGVRYFGFRDVDGNRLEACETLPG